MTTIEECREFAEQLIRRSYTPKPAKVNMGRRAADKPVDLPTLLRYDVPITNER